MKERGMIFNGEMVRAILDGRKTQTRRIMKNQPAGDYPETPALIRNVGTGFQWHGLYGESSIFNCPLGSIGERIWVRETFRVHSRATDVATLVYRASVRNSWTEQTHRVPVAVCNKPATPEKWTPSIHMPRWASRLLLEITDVRVERLNNISECDAKAEGGPTECTLIGDKYFPGFRSLWKSIYGEESWDANPWVWVIEFKRVEGGAV
ncbi:hypothetical protein K6I73_000798 [Salmonella enterica subsp. diarizonae serovar 35:k:e,n,x,z15]|nr:hypothetical protein [Salmonella enterica]EAW1261386.1 hypothetical protein [Salmonella enterica subsp. diarizonae]EEC5248702.1 hypothetical protein [Salmonella enterica subsp. enterica]EIE2761266.1 hypothetical protein [Salmonella enterica subsp. diarizonae serovar 35:k:e,n,x,z15]EBF9341193.1 hypothetical protein [Salmonella enterica]